MATTIKEIIEDVSVSIGDIETLIVFNPESQDLKRACGQMRAARMSLASYFAGISQQKEATK